MWAKTVQDFVEETALDLLQPVLGHLQQTALTAAALEPVVNVVAEWSSRYANLTAVAIGQPVQLAGRQAEPLRQCRGRR
jgi:hypothetical protein